MEQNVTPNMGQSSAPNAAIWCDELKFNRVHLISIVFLGAWMIFDGYGLFMIAAIMSPMMKELHLTPVAAGSLGSYTFIGLLLGCIGFGTLADLIGRKKVIIISQITYSVFSVFSFWAPSFSCLVVLRFLAGMGMGGASVAISTAAELVPARTRARSSMIMISGGIGTGAIISAILAMTVLPIFGWRSLFLFEFLALMLIPLMILYLPESIRYLAQKQRYVQGTRELRRLERAAGVAPISWTPASFALPAQAKGRVKDLFSRNFAAMTILIWLVYVITAVAVFGMQTWLPSLLIKEGYSAVRSYGYSMMPQIGMCLGMLWIGMAMDRFGRKQALMAALILGGAFTCLFSVAHGMFGFCIVGLGWGMTGQSAMSGMHVVAGEVYPTRFRATAVGWAMGLSRLGGALGPLLGGILQSAGFTFREFFIIFALPSFIGAVLVFLFPINVKGESVEAVTDKLVVG